MTTAPTDVRGARRADVAPDPRETADPAVAGPRTEPAALPTDLVPGRMTHREILSALSGLLMAMFVAFLSSTIVANALPTIITDLRGTQSQYTWIVTATLLASTASTPIWGKLADLFSKKLLVQLSIIVFITGSVLAGLSSNVETLIAWRVLQGLGMGGLQALAVIVMAAIISPRERGRYAGLMGGVMALSTVCGPLIGGVIVDTDWLGWRWCFFVGVPLAAIALVMLQRTLDLPVVKRKVHIDYLGAILLTVGVSALLIWTTLAGNTFAWGSWQTAALVGVGVAAIAAFLVVETRSTEPIVPLRLFRDRTTTLAVIASVVIGVAMFGSSVFLGQYLQISRSYSPTEAGLLTLPMIAGLLVGSTGSGALITRYGKWKGFLVAGGVFLVAGFGLLATIDHETDMVLMGSYLVILGLGVGLTMQNLVLAVQNSVPAGDLGAASSSVSFFRSLGGAVGVSVLGAILSSRVGDLIVSGASADPDLAAQVAGSSDGSVGLANLADAPPAVQDLIRLSYGDATGRIFLVAAVLSIIPLIAIILIREIPLRTQSGQEQLAELAKAEKVG